MGKNTAATPFTQAERRRRHALARAVRGLLLGTATTTTALLPAAALHAQQAESRHYDIPAGSLTEVLKRFGVDSGQMLSFSTELTTGRHSPGLHGRYTVAEALQAVLAQTGLEAVPQDGGYLLRRSLAPAREDARLAPVTVTAQLPGNVTEGSGAYTPVGPLTTATPLGLTLKETPQSVSVITSQRMEDQGLTTIRQTLAQAPGVLGTSWNTELSEAKARGYTLSNYQFDGTSTFSQLLGAGGVPAQTRV